MRYEKGHKAETRRHITDAAARRFREDGIAAAGVAGLMADAGLTNGAFYTHFKSKEHLVREVLVQTLGHRRERMRGTLQGDAGPEAWIRRYLSPAHRDNPSMGCPTSALAAELARHPIATRKTFTDEMLKSIDVITSRMPGKAEKERRRKAIALYGMLIGTLQLARAVSDETISREILESGVEAALQLSRSGDDSIGVTACDD